jgi:hypothetical protein
LPRKIVITNRADEDVHPLADRLNDRPSRTRCSVHATRGRERSRSFAQDFIGVAIEQTIWEIPGDRRPFLWWRALRWFPSTAWRRWWRRRGAVVGGGGGGGGGGGWEADGAVEVARKPVEVARDKARR